MKKFLRSIALGLMIVGSAAIATAEDGWVRYEATDYGFSMLMPEGTKYVEREHGGGWGELYAEYDGVKFCAGEAR